MAGTAPRYTGFVTVDPVNRNYYTRSMGKSFFGVGANLDFPEFTKFTCKPSVKLPNDVCLSSQSPTRGILGDGINKTPMGMSPQALYQVYESYVAALDNLASAGANSGRLRLDSRFIPLELDPAYDGIPGYPHGVPDFAIGRYNDANAWIADQIVSLAAQDGLALQLTTWNADQIPWGSEYADAHEASLVHRRPRGRGGSLGIQPERAQLGVLERDGQEQQHEERVLVADDQISALDRRGPPCDYQLIPGDRHL